MLKLYNLSKIFRKKFSNKILAKNCFWKLNKHWLFYVTSATFNLTKWEKKGTIDESDLGYYFFYLLSPVFTNKCTFSKSTVSISIMNVVNYKWLFCQANSVFFNVLKIYSNCMIFSNLFKFSIFRKIMVDDIHIYFKYK